MKEKLRLNIGSKIFSSIYTSDVNCRSAKMLEEDHCLIHYEDSSKGFYLEVYTDTPSNQSFVIFGGLYDPKSGYIYATLNKNCKAVIAFDCVEVLSEIYGKSITAKEITDAFISYKLSGDLYELDNRFKSRVVGSREPSTIYSHLTATRIEVSDKNDVIILFKTTFLYNIASVNTLVSHASGYETIELNSSFVDYPKSKLEKQNISYMDDISLYYSSSAYSMKTVSSDIIPIGNTSETKRYEISEILLKENIEELYDTKETLVYAKDNVSTLRRNGFAGYVNKSNIKKLQDADTIETKYTFKNIVTKNDIKEKIRSQWYAKGSRITQIIPELIYINKTFRKLSK